MEAEDEASVVKKAAQDYLDDWSSRLSASILELAMLYMAGYESNEELYPVSIRRKLEEVWGETLTPHLQTVYATYKRLKQREHRFILETKSVKAGRSAKHIVATSDIGMPALKQMIDTLTQLLSYFQFEDKLLEFKLPPGDDK